MSRVRVVVIGAGAFGGWSALELVRRGAQVTLVDAWGPGHARSSSGGETRVIRATYGSHVVYTRMAARALRLWREHERRSGVRLLYQTGALWIFADDTAFRAGSAAALRSEGLPCEQLSTAEAGRRYPQVRFDDVQAVMVEPEAGYLLARQACEHVAASVALEGGELLQGTAPAPLLPGNPLRRLELLDGRVLEADAFVFACGPWLPAIFPDVIGQRISITRQEVYYFGTP
ncbi:MAG TPA: FAD-dependent oxidoreductase, partial [Vicinamibacterales bacterium]|nr:FAD-dependent oxidoreductase [Vicinamibacterales bacterium]